MRTPRRQIGTSRPRLPDSLCRWHSLQQLSCKPVKRAKLQTSAAGQALGWPASPPLPLRHNLSRFSVCCQSTHSQQHDTRQPEPTLNAGQNRLLATHQRLLQLREARLKSEARVRDLRGQDKPKPSGSEGQPPSKLVSSQKSVDRRVYDQVSASRNRLSQQLSAKNRYIRHLETMLEERTEVVSSAHKAIVKLGNELESVKRLAEVAVAAAAFGVEKAEAVARSERIARRAESLQEGVRMEAKALDRLVLRKVPITWFGVASEVKFMGDFDNWTQGFSLSPVTIQDQTFSHFQGDVPLLPGTYRVKFKLDDAHWRLASDWPTVQEEDGSTNNVLIVE